MSEQQAEATHGESGSVSAGSSVSPSSDTSSQAAAAADLAVSVLETPAVAPDHEALPKDEIKKDEIKNEAMVEAPRIGVPKQETPRATGKVLIMAPSDRGWHDHSAEVKVESGARAKAAPRIEHKTEAKTEPKIEHKSDKPKRGFPAMAAMLALATIAGAIGGALATTGLTHVADASATTTPGSSTFEASIARIDSDVIALKAGLEHTAKSGVSQFNKTSDRLDKIEKAQAEPNAKLAKLTEAVDKLRAAPPAAAAPVQAVAATPATAKEVTGSVTPPAAAAPAPVQVAAAPAAPPKPEVARLPTVDGWALADVGYGGALIENRRGTYEVYAGDFIPGLGRIDAIRKQDGHWVVVTSKGLIVAR